MYGALSGLRLGVAILACAFLVLRADPDLLTGLASRVAPRSALLVALAARLVPTMRRDASSLSDAARARGLALRSGPRKARVGAASTLVAPLLASGLERGLETAEAMTARGYGAGPRTQLPARARARRRTAALAAGARTRRRRGDPAGPDSAVPVLSRARERGRPRRARGRALCLGMLLFALGVVERCSPS